MTTTNTDAISAFAAQTNKAAANKPRDQLDQSSFMQLMIAQFKNQDPTKPQDPSQFLTQLAQFSTVSGVQDMQASLSALSDSLRSSQVLDGAVMVGHNILAPRDSTLYSGAGALKGALDVPEGASNVTINIKDASGQLVRTMIMPVQQGELNDFAWDGITDRGTAAPAQQYTLSAVTNLGGKSESVPVLLAARVDSVTIDAKNNQLTVNTGALGSIPLSDVRRIM